MVNRLTAAEIDGMRDEVVNVQLDHTCIVQRSMAGAVDGNNVPTITWATLLNGVPCHYWQETETEILNGQAAEVMRSRIVFAANTAITDKDRVSSVLDNDGDQLVGVPLDIEEVIEALNQVVVRVKGVQ